MLFSRLGPYREEYRYRFFHNVDLSLAAGYGSVEAERRAYVTIRQLARWAGLVG